MSANKEMKLLLKRKDQWVTASKPITNIYIHLHYNLHNNSQSLTSIYDSFIVTESRDSKQECDKESTIKPTLQYFVMLPL